MAWPQTSVHGFGADKNSRHDRHDKVDSMGSNMTFIFSASALRPFFIVPRSSFLIFSSLSDASATLSWSLIRSRCSSTRVIDYLRSLTFFRASSRSLSALTTRSIFSNICCFIRSISRFCSSSYWFIFCTFCLICSFSVRAWLTFLSKSRKSVCAFSKSFFRRSLSYCQPFVLLSRARFVPLSCSLKLFTESFARSIFTDISWRVCAWLLYISSCRLSFFAQFFDLLFEQFLGDS